MRKDTDFDAWKKDLDERLAIERIKGAPQARTERMRKTIRRQFQKIKKAMRKSRRKIREGRQSAALSALKDGLDDDE